MKKTLLILLSLLLVVSVTFAFAACNTDDPCAEGHSWDDGTPQTPASCESAGVTVYRCRVCGKTETRSEPAKLGHDYTLQGWTWENDYSGATAHFTCSRGDLTATQDVTDDDLQSAVQSDGSTVYTASVTGPDGGVYTDTHTKPADGHRHTKGTKHDEQPATCTQAGVAEYWDCEANDGTRLNAAGDEVTDAQLALAALGHTYTVDGALTWKVSGAYDKAILHLVCSVCADGTDGHTLDVELTAKQTTSDASTCGATGSITYTVSVEDTDNAAAITAAVVVPNKLAQGALDSVEPLTHTDNNAQRGHDWKLAQESAFDWDGTTKDSASVKVKYVCQTCSKEITITFTDAVGTPTAATCTAAGHVEYTLTKTADQVKSAAQLSQHEGVTLYTTDSFQEITAQTHTVDGDPATGHSWQQPTWAWNNEYTSATATFACSECTETQTVTATEGGADGNVITHSQTTAPKCETPGVETYTATVTGPDSQTYNGTKTKDVDATGHSYVLDESEGTQGWTWEADYSKATAHLKCEHDNCETPKTTVVDEQPTSNTTNQATCTQSGTTKHTATVTIPGKSEQVTNTVEETVQALDHDFVNSTVYRDNEDGTHSAQCARQGCDEYDTKRVAHVYTKQDAYTHTTGEQHNAKCDLCGNEKSEPCTLTDDVCSKCHEDYRDEVTVHFHLPASGWNASKLKAYAWYGADETQVDVFGAFPGTGTFESEGSNNWYQITFRVARGHLNNDLYVIASSKTVSAQKGEKGETLYEGPQTGNVKVTLNEIWIPGLEGTFESFTSAALAEAAEKDVPDDSDWIITGNSIGNWSATSVCWTNTFGERNSYTLTFHFDADDQFKIKLIGDDSSWSHAIKANSTNRYTLTKEWTFDAAADTIIVNGGANDYNFKVASACTVKFVLHPNENASLVTVDIIILSVDGETHIHAHSGVEHPLVPATCTQPGTKQYWDCACGKHLDADNQEIDITIPAATDSTDASVHNGMLVQAQAATHTQDGWVAYYKCSNCGKCAKEQNGEYSFADDAAIRADGEVKQAATGHQYQVASESPYTWQYQQGTTAKVTIKFTCTCKEQDNTITVTVTIENGVETQADCVNAHTVAFTLNKTADQVKTEAERPNDTFVDVSDTYTEIIEAAQGHHYILDNDFGVENEKGFTWSDDHKNGYLHLVCDKDTCQPETEGHKKQVEFGSKEQNIGGSCTTASQVKYTVEVTKAYVESELEGNAVDIQDATFTYTSNDSEIPGHKWVIDTAQGDQGFDWTIEDTQATVKVYLKCEKETETTNSITLTFTLTGEDIVVKDATCAADKTITVVLNKGDAEQRSAVDQDCQEKVQTQDSFPTLNVTKVQTDEGSHLAVDHTFEGKYFDDEEGKHYQKCSVCQTESVHEEHIWSTKYTSKGSAGHYRECTKCDAIDESEHKLKWISDGEATHHQECECGYVEASVSHGELKWVKTATQHYQTCEKCDYKTTAQNHSFTYTNHKSAKNHSISCSVCHFDGGTEKCESFLDNNMCGRCDGDYRSTVGYAGELVVVGKFASLNWDENVAYKLDSVMGEDPHYFLHIHFKTGDEFKIKHWGDSTWSQGGWGYNDIKQCSTSSRDVDKSVYFSTPSSGGDNIVVKQNMTVYIDLYKNNNWLKLYIELG